MTKSANHGRRSKLGSISRAWKTSFRIVQPSMECSRRLAKRATTSCPRSPSSKLVTITTDSLAELAFKSASRICNSETQWITR